MRMNGASSPTLYPSLLMILDGLYRLILFIIMSLTSPSALYASAAPHQHPFNSQTNKACVHFWAK